MTPNPFDQGARYTAKLNPPGFYSWLLPELVWPLVYQSWLDTRSIPFPGDPDRICDTVAAFVDQTDAAKWWALPTEFQTEPANNLFGRLLEYLARLWLELRPPGLPRDRFQVVGAVVNLTGRGQTSLDMILPNTALRTCLIVAECNLQDKDAAQTLTGIGNRSIARCILPFIPLMQGGANPAIMKRWKEIAKTEPEGWLRGDYAGLALVFAELTDCREAWKKALEGWNVRQSVQVLEWQAEAEQRGLARGRSESLLRVIRKRLSPTVPAAVEDVIQATTDLDQLNRWLDDASTASSMAEFQRLAGLKPKNGSRKRGKANGANGGRAH